MGYSVLYIAFGIVALWLLGEVLLQYKARLRWRVLAFAGFLGLVIGVADRSVVLIVLGALAFGTGQSQVTLSYKRGFSTGWAIGGRPGSSRRRRAAGARPAEPVLEVGPIEADQAAGQDPAQQASPAEELAGVGANATAVHDFSVPSGDPQGQGGGYGAEQAVYQPMPMQDDSGEYPLYDGQSTYTPDPYTSGGYEGYGAQGYQSWTGYEQQQPAWDQGQEQGQRQGQEQDGGGYQEQPAPAAASYGYDPDDYDVFGNARGTDGGGYGGQGAEDWQSYPQQPAADTYGGYGYDPQAYGQQQPYIPQQQHQPPYEQQQQPEQQQEYADPYDPYRY